MPFCAACGKSVSIDDAFCRACGSRQAASAPQDKGGSSGPSPAATSVAVERPKKKFNVLAYSIIGVVTFFILIAMFASPKDDPHKATQPSSPPVNLLDAKALDDQYGAEASGACSAQADFYLKTVAKYDFKWDDGLLDQKFNVYLTKVKSPGVLTRTSDKVKLENGFGAYIRSTLECDYDTQHPGAVQFTLQQND